MDIEEWRSELRRNVRPLLTAYLAERGLPALTATEFNFLIRYEPQPTDDNPVTWLEEVKQGAERLATARLEQQPDVPEPLEVHQPAPADDVRWQTLAQILAIEANASPFISNWRHQHLAKRYLQHEEVAEFREQLPEAAVRWLEQLAAQMVEWSGWWDIDDAAIFILTGTPPPARRIRTRIIVRDRAGTSRVIIEADPRASPQAVADSYRQARDNATLKTLNIPEDARRNVSLNGARPHPVSTKGAELALHLAHNRQASWKQRRERWNSTRQGTKPEWTYSADAGFARDAGRAWKQIVGEPFAHKPNQRIPII